MPKYLIFGLVVLSGVIYGAYLVLSPQEASSHYPKTSDEHEIKVHSPVQVHKHQADERARPNVIEEHFDDVAIDTDQTQLKTYEEDWCFAVELTEAANAKADDDYFKWSVERNHIVGDRQQLLDTYHNYGLDALKELGEQGDLVALAAIALNSKNSIEIQDWAARTAAIYGGTGNALQHIPSSRKGRAASLLLRGQTDEAKKVFLEGMAWDEFMVLRGDTTSLETTPFLLSLEAYKDLEIKPADEEWVSARARSIYAELNNERIQKGLGEFDNTVPKSVEIENLAAAAYAIKQYGAKQHHTKYYSKNKCLQKRLASLTGAESELGQLP